MKIIQSIIINSDLYHYIAWGRTLEPHMYRNINDTVPEPNIEQYITEMLQKSSSRLHESLYIEDPAIIAAFEVEKDSDEDKQEFNDEVVRERLSEAMDAYKEKILSLHTNYLQDPAMNKAMMAFTKTLRKSMKCTPSTLQKQMHEFGKGTVATNRTKHGGTIHVNPPALSRRTFKVPGRGPAPLGRPFKKQDGRTQLFVSDEDEECKVTQTSETRN